MFDADIDLGPLWRTKTTPTPDYPNDPALDKLIDEGRGTLDETSARPLIPDPEVDVGSLLLDPGDAGRRHVRRQQPGELEARPDEMIWAKEMKPRTT